MSRAIITESLLTGIADAIRDKLGGSDTYTPSDMADAIYDISGGGGSMQSKTISPSESQVTVRPDSGYSGLSSVTVNAIGSDYVGSGITRRSSSDLTASGETVTAPAGYYGQSASMSVAIGSAATPATSITANPTITVDASGLVTATVSGSESVAPTVSAGYVSSGTAGAVSVSGSSTSQLSTQSAATITPSTSQQTAVAAGKYTTGNVVVSAMPSGTAGTPTVAKSISGHTATVTPSVTNATGYITGGTLTGSSVTVTSSELVSGNLAITSNGTGIDVTDYETVSVDVPTVTPTGTISITANGTYNVESYASAEVDVPSGGTSNLAEGTFTGSTTGAVMDIDLGYTGNGYPIAVVIFPDEGMQGDTDYYNTVQRYAIGFWSMSKNYQGQTPTYTTSGSANLGVVSTRYKSSASSATSFSLSGSNGTNIYSSSAPSANVSTAARLRNNTTLRVFIASTSYGFMAGITYRYIVVYSE